MSLPFEKEEVGTGIPGISAETRNRFDPWLARNIKELPDADFKRPVEGKFIIYFKGEEIGEITEEVDRLNQGHIFRFFKYVFAAKGPLPKYENGKYSESFEVPEYMKDLGTDYHYWAQGKINPNKNPKEQVAQPEKKKAGRGRPRLHPIA